MSLEKLPFRVFGVNFSGWGFRCQRLVSPAPLVPWLGLGICEVSWLYSFLLAVKFSCASTINSIKLKRKSYNNNNNIDDDLSCITKLVVCLALIGGVA